MCDYRWHDSPIRFIGNTVTFGGMGLRELEAALLKNRVAVEPDIAKKMMHSDAFKAELRKYKKPKTVHVCYATIGELGLRDSRTPEVFGRIHDLGYDKLPSIVAPWMLLGVDRRYYCYRGALYMEPIEEYGWANLFYIQYVSSPFPDGGILKLDSYNSCWSREQGIFFCLRI